MPSENPLSRHYEALQAPDRSVDVQKLQVEEGRLYNEALHDTANRVLTYRIDGDQKYHTLFNEFIASANTTVYRAFSAEVASLAREGVKDPSQRSERLRTVLMQARASVEANLHTLSNGGKKISIAHLSDSFTTDLRSIAALASSTGRKEAFKQILLRRITQTAETIRSGGNNPFVKNTAIDALRGQLGYLTAQVGGDYALYPEGAAKRTAARERGASQEEIDAIQAETVQKSHQAVNEVFTAVQTSLKANPDLLSLLGAASGEGDTARPTNANLLSVADMRADPEVAAAWKQLHQKEREAAVGNGSAHKGISVVDLGMTAYGALISVTSLFELVHPNATVANSAAKIGLAYAMIESGNDGFYRARQAAFASPEGVISGEGELEKTEQRLANTVPAQAILYALDARPFTDSLNLTRAPLRAFVQRIRAQGGELRDEDLALLTKPPFINPDTIQPEEQRTAIRAALKDPTTLTTAQRQDLFRIIEYAFTNGSSPHTHAAPDYAFPKATA